MVLGWPRWIALLGTSLGLLFWTPGSFAAKKLQLEDIFSDAGLAGPSPADLRWSPDGRLLTYILPTADGKERDLWVVDAATGKKRILVGHRQLEQLAPTVEAATADERERERRLRYAVAAYHWSPDSKSILFTSAGKLYLYDVNAERARPLATAKLGIRDAKFSPNGRWVSFIYQHDIWLAPTSGGEERQLTRGATEERFHGDLDWIYPEELGVRSGYHWSPDGRRIAFLELDQSRVPTYPISNHSLSPPTVDFQRYPRAGERNPNVRVGIIEAKPSRRRKPEALWLEGEAEYTPRVSWAGDNQVAIQLLNRAQTKLELVFADANNGRSRTVLVEQDPYWINLSDDLTFLHDRREFLWTSEGSGFRHIYLYDYDGKRRRRLTEGDWEVKAIEGVDRQEGWVYYTSNEDNLLGSDLYRVRFDAGSKERLTRSKGTHSIVMNPKTTAYADQHSALTRVPRMEVRHFPSGRTTEVRRALPVDDYDLVEPQLLEWKAPDGALIRGMLLKPRPLEPGRKYPTLIYVYGGPRAPTIRDAWESRGRYLFHQYLAQKGYVVFQIDDRASSLLGHRYESAIHRNYGPIALGDYRVAVEHIRAMKFVDADRLAIWGRSGGGFSVCFAMTHSKLFKVGIAVAPVTDWRLYDSIYTERYMGHPDKEAAAYEKTSAVAAAKDLHGRLLLVHGTADDNVHLANTMQMIAALVEAGKPYDLLLYPGKTHSMHGANTRVHLFGNIERYLNDHL